MQLKLKYIFIVTCFEVGTLYELELGFKNLFEELAFDLNILLHLHNGHASWLGLIGGLLEFVYVT